MKSPVALMICTLFFVLPLHSIDAQETILRGRHFDTNCVPVYKSRVFVVPSEQAYRAFSILGDRKFRSITNDQLEELLPGEEISDVKMLRTQEMAALDYVKKRESSTRNSAQDEIVQDTIKAHKEYVRYTEGIKELHPTLVVAYGLRKGGGRFIVDLERYKIRVAYETLSEKHSKYEKIPIIVFLERPINDVETVVAGGE